MDGIQDVAVVPIRDDNTNQNYTGLVMCYTTTPEPPKKTTIVRQSESEAVAFKCARLGERQGLGSAIALTRVASLEAQKLAQDRRTWRMFASSALPRENFESDIVESLRETCASSSVEMKYLLYVREGGISGVPSGFYQIGKQFSLKAESTSDTFEQLPADTVFGENESIFRTSSGAIFMLQSGTTCTPAALIEAGRIGHRLMQSVASEDAATGFCPIGAINSSALYGWLASGNKSSTVVHTMCFGPVLGSVGNSTPTHMKQTREQQLRARLTSELPQYMVPRSYFEVDAMPLSKNGKVDRRALEILYHSDNRERLAHNSVQASCGDSSSGDVNVSPAETELLVIWKNRLKGATNINTKDDFLALGGDSLVALQMIVDARAKGLQFSVTDLFAARTIQNMARLAAGQQYNAESAQNSRDKAMETKDMSRLPQLLEDPAKRHEPFGLTPVQQAYWVGRHEEMNLGNTSTHGYLEWKVTSFKLERLQSALVSLVERHEMLRAIVRQDGLQQVLPVSHKTYPAVNVIDLTKHPEQEAEMRRVQIRNRLSHEIFDPSKWPLFSVSAISVSEVDCYVGFSYDMLVFDVRSIFMFVDQLFLIYHGREHVYTKPKISFRDYTEALERWKYESSDYHNSIQFWRQTFVEHRPRGPDLPLASRPEDIEQPRFLRQELRFSAAVWSSFSESATENGLTPSAVLLSLFGLVLRQWCSDENRPFCINVPVSSRLPLHVDVDRLIGDFTTTIFITFQGSSTCFLEQARATAEQLMERIEHRHVSGVEVLRSLSTGDPSIMSEMAVPVVFTSALDISVEAHSDIEFSYGVSQTSQVWLDCQVYTENDTLIMNWDYVSGLFAPGLVDTMATLFYASVGRLSASSSWDTLKITSGVDMPDGGDDLAAANNHQLLHSAFVQHACSHGERPAVVSAETGRIFSYRQLLDQAVVVHNWVAQHVSHKAEQTRLVAVVTNKGWEEVVAVLGVLCTGAAYIPISASLPPNRIRQLLDLCEASCVLTHSAIKSYLGFLDAIAPTLCVDAIDYPGTSTKAHDQIIVSGDGGSLAYVIFTSGSTGVPKGVMIQHCAALNTIDEINRRFEVGSADRVLGVSSLSFDLSVWDIFGILSVGGCLVIPSADSVRDPAQWVECIRAHGVTIWNSVPQLLSMLVEHVGDARDVAVNGLSSMRLALLSGDWIPVGLPTAFRAVTSDATSVISLGGATEASIWSVIFPIDEVKPEWVSIPYGKALANQRIYCLNANFEVTLPWVRGELYLAGVGLAVGYWKAPDLTATQFILHPETGERLYRTGDMGRLTDTGDIEFLGRVDSQVKLSGYRVELGEVEVVLQSHPQVQHAVPLVVDISSSRALVAAVVPTGSVDDTFNTQLCNFVKSRLPDYMVPRAIVTMDSLPLTKNGKVDGKQLHVRMHHAIEMSPEQDLHVSPGHDVKHLAVSLALDPIVSNIVSIWQDVLKIPVEPNSDFFVDLEGASAVAIQLINTVNACLNTKMAVAKLFSHPTPLLQAELVRQGGGCESITPIVDLAPSSTASHRVYCIHPAGGSSICYARAARALENDLHLFGVDDLHSVAQLSQSVDGSAEDVASQEDDIDLHADVEKELSIKELARRYAQFIVEHAKGEEFALVGFSFGGIIAWEVASHLNEASKVVGISLIDTDAQGETTMTDEAILGNIVEHYRRSTGQNVETLNMPSNATQNQDELCQLVADHMEEAGLYPQGIGFSALKRFLALFRRHIRMIDAYTFPSTLGRRVPAIFVSGLDSSRQQREFWNGLCTHSGGLLHAAVPGHHDEMLSELHSSTTVGSCAQFFQGNPLQLTQLQDGKKAHLKQVVVECLQVDIDPQQLSEGTDLWTLGANSVFYVKLQRRLKKDLGVDVRLPALLAAPRLSDLSAIVMPHVDTHESKPGEAAQNPSCTPLREDYSNPAEAAAGHSSVAIIGMSCRLPGEANSPEEFWNNLINSVDCISRFSSNKSADSNWIGASGLVHGTWMDCFDCELFQMTRKESSILDPQHRLFLELVWEALEQSGIREREKAVGVWSSFAPNTYLQALLKQHAVAEPTGTADMLQLLLGNERDYASARLSYLLDLRGPSMNVQTACSSSLVAMHLARESLNRGDCAAAVVGAVSLAFPMRRGYTWEQGGIFSQRGRCAAFDVSADGTVPGFGGASVIMQPIGTIDAQSNHYAVRAVLRGGAVNHDGRRKPGFTAPSMQAQFEVLRAAFISAERSPSTLGMIEAHGTGTVLGDPIEGTALLQLLASATDARASNMPVALGSVKSNIGHLDAAAGLAGVVKVVLALEHSKIPPTLHVSQPNPAIPWGSHLAPVTQAQEWPGLQSTAGVSSFGMSGTNAHIVLQQPQKSVLDDATQAPEAVGQPSLLTLSAASERSLQSSVENLRSWAKDHPDCTLANVALTLHRRHEHRLGYQATAVAHSNVRAISSTDFIVHQSGDVDVVFLIPGQGVQSLEHVASMYSYHAGFRLQVQECCDLLCAQDEWQAVGTSVLRAIASGRSISLTGQAEQQACVFVVNYAMSQVWIQTGVTPRCVCGHSLGDLVACCISGAVELKDMLRLVAKRGQLVDSLARTDGGMLAVRCTEDVLCAELTEARCSGKLVLAAVNQQNQLVVAGLGEDVARFESHMKNRGIAAHRLPVQHAFHTLAMEAASRELKQLFANINEQPQEAKSDGVVHISTVTGQRLQEQPTAEYFAQQLVLPVQFCAAVESAICHGPSSVEGAGATTHRVLLEVGPSTTLTSIVAGLGTGLSSFPHHSRSQMDGYSHWLHTCGILWSLGVPVQLPGLTSPDEATKYLSGLPPYVFDREQLTAPSQRAIGESGSNPKKVDSTENTKEMLNKLFQDTLACSSPVDVNSNFFTLRGSSLDVVQLLNGVRSTLGVTITMSQFLQQPTVQGLYDLVSSGDHTQSSDDSKPVSGTDTTHKFESWHPLSFSQEAIYAIEHIYPRNDGVYNLPSAFIFPVGTLTQAQLSDHLARLVAKHDSLRATFRSNSSATSTKYTPCMSVADTYVVEVEQISIHRNSPGDESDDQEALDRELRRFTNKPFDLRAGPLIRAGVVSQVVLSKVGAEVTVAVVVLHHLVCDGLSAGVLLGNLALDTIDAGKALDLPEQSYVEFVKWERRWIETRAAEIALEYWRGELARLLYKENAMVLSLQSTIPADPDRANRADASQRRLAIGRERSFGGGSVAITLSKDTVQNLRKVASQFGVTLTVVLMGLYACSLWKCAARSNNPKLIPIGVPVANRPHGFQRLVGCCMNMVVLCCDVKPDELLTKFLINIQQKVAAAVDHSYPFTELVRKLAPPRARGYNPLYQAVFNVRPAEQRHPATTSPLLGPQVPYRFDSDRSQNDIGLHLVEPAQQESSTGADDDCCSGYLEYNDQILDRSEATDLARSFIRLTNYVATRSAADEGSMATILSTLDGAFGS
eukprot:COSAG02_NODE_47_length_45434_cov_101.776221_8_plen_3424_part_00